MMEFLILLLLEIICALSAILIIGIVLIGLRLWHDKQVQGWIDAGLIKRKPRVYTRYSRYK